MRSATLVRETWATAVASDSSAFAIRSSSVARLSCPVMGCPLETGRWLGGELGGHPSEFHLTGNRFGAQRIFAIRVPGYRTGWLASSVSTAYTELVARVQRPSATRAAERACLQRQPGQKPTIFFESFILYPASFLLAHSWRNISGPTVTRL